MSRRNWGAVLVAAALIVGSPAVASAAVAPTHTEGTPVLGTGTDPYLADQTTDTAAAADESLVISDSGVVSSSTGLTAAQLTGVQHALVSGNKALAAVHTPAGVNTAGTAVTASIAGVSIHHTWHWWGLHVWADFTTTETNYIYYHSWTLAAIVAGTCGVIAAIDAWAGAACLVAAGVEAGRILDGVDYAHDHHKGLRLDYDITWAGTCWISTGTA